MDLPSISEQADHPYVSTGHLPEPEVQRLVFDAHQRFQSNRDGHNSQVYPALARVPRTVRYLRGRDRRPAGAAVMFEMRRTT